MSSIFADVCDKWELKSPSKISNFGNNLNIILCRWNDEIRKQKNIHLLLKLPINRRISVPYIEQIFLLLFYTSFWCKQDVCPAFILSRCAAILCANIASSTISLNREIVHPQTVRIELLLPQFEFRYRNKEHKQLEINWINKRKEKKKIASADLFNLSVNYKIDK